MARTDRPGLPRQVDGPVTHARLKAGSTSLPLDFLDETITFWQPRAQRTLTHEDAREIVENLTGFFAILREWQEAERAVDRAAISPAAPTTPSTQTPRARKTRAHKKAAEI